MLIGRGRLVVSRTIMALAFTQPTLAPFGAIKIFHMTNVHPLPIHETNTPS